MTGPADLVALELELAEGIAPGTYLAGGMGLAAPEEVARAGRAKLTARARARDRQARGRALAATSPIEADRARQVFAPRRR